MIDQPPPLVIIEIVLLASQVESECWRLGMPRQHLVACSVMAPGNVCYFVVPKAGVGGVTPARQAQLEEHEITFHCVEGRRHGAGVFR